MEIGLHELIIIQVYPSLRRFAHAMTLEHTITYDQLVAFAEEWRRVDSDPENIDEIDELLREASPDDHAHLRERFSGRLSFGTAGLRGKMGAGPQRMCMTLIRWVTLGLGSYIQSTLPQEAHVIVIGYDGRLHSKRFAEESAAQLVRLGFHVELCADLCPTPLLSFAVRHRAAVAGIMVTASHNPPEYNGFKVYWSNGAQIIPPQDVEISEAIDRIKLDQLENLDQEKSTEGSLSSLAIDFESELGQAYWSAVSSYQLPQSAPPPRPLRIVYTAMHGVGTEWCQAVMAQRKDIELILVPEQCAPDPHFPTVAFPNPEEPGALDLAFALAEEHHADLILAHDPDADRLAVVARDREGALRAFTGDQVGALIAHELFTQLEVGSEDMVATTIVSSSLLERMAQENNVRYLETLTGFKWIVNRSIEHQEAGGRFLFGYEEAIGYSIFGIVRDKDGVSAGLFLADMALRAFTEGETLWTRMAEIYSRYGLFLSALKSRVREGSTGAQMIDQWMSDLRARPPSLIAGKEVTEITDFLKISPPMTSDVLRYRLSDGSRVIARPSGTEPKIKFYFEVCISDSTLSETDAQVVGSARLTELETDFLAYLDSL